MSTEPRTKRRTFDEPFKRDAVALARKGDKPQEQLAKELGICAKSLRDWTKLYGPPPPVRSAAVLEVELRTLRRENEHLRAQRDILKKTLGILVEPPPNASPA
jgi:transposase